MTRILAIADERDPSLSYRRIRTIAPDVVVSCGDLPFDYLEFVVTAANKPLLYVPGNHDPALADRKPHLVAGGFGMSGPHGGPGSGLAVRSKWGDPPGPLGCTPLDGRVEQRAGLRFGGLGGSIRYRPEPPHMYTQQQMRRRALRLKWRAKVRQRGLDVLVTHSPPAGLGDGADDAHRGFEAFHGLVEALQPRLLLHGHVHPHGFQKPDRQIGETTVVNVIPSKVLEV